MASFFHIWLRCCCCCYLPLYSLSTFLFLSCCCIASHHYFCFTTHFHSYFLQTIAIGQTFPQTDFGSTKFLCVVFRNEAAADNFATKTKKIYQEISWQLSRKHLTRRNPTFNCSSMLPRQLIRII